MAIGGDTNIIKVQAENHSLNNEWVETTVFIVAVTAQSHQSSVVNIFTQ